MHLIPFHQHAHNLSIGNTTFSEIFTCTIHFKKHNIIFKPPLVKYFSKFTQVGLYIEVIITHRLVLIATCCRWMSWRGDQGYRICAVIAQELEGLGGFGFGRLGESRVGGEFGRLIIGVLCHDGKWVGVWTAFPQPDSREIGNPLWMDNGFRAAQKQIMTDLTEWWIQQYLFQQVGIGFLNMILSYS